MKLDNTELSDLFFNHTHKTYDNLKFGSLSAAIVGSDLSAMSFGNAVEVATLRAIHVDAVAFVDSYPVLCNGVCAQELVDDFIDRL